MKVTEEGAWTGPTEIIHLRWREGRDLRRGAEPKMCGPVSGKATFGVGIPEGEERLGEVSVP